MIKILKKAKETYLPLYYSQFGLFHCPNPNFIRYINKEDRCCYAKKKRILEIIVEHRSKIKVKKNVSLPYAQKARIFKIILLHKGLLDMVNHVFVSFQGSAYRNVELPRSEKKHFIARKTALKKDDPDAPDVIIQYIFFPFVHYFSLMIKIRKIGSIYFSISPVVPYFTLIINYKDILKFKQWIFSKWNL